LVATSDGEETYGPKNEPTIQLWETATGKPISLVKGIRLVPYVMSFAPDGRTLLYTCWNAWGLGQETSRERAAILRDIAGFDDLPQVTGREFQAVCLVCGESLPPLQGHVGRIT
jgi:hypothetical protein